jgi:cyclopropane fatty-acyl-phospholipid synthase-like methyltransferase
MDFQNEFDGVTCIDALEHVFPEEWLGIVRGFREALKPDGVLYFTVDLGGDHVEEAYKRAKALGLPVVFGEVADQVEELYERADLYGEEADRSVYHYHPSLKQVRSWVSQEGLLIEEEGTGKWYKHFIMRKN